MFKLKNLYQVIFMASVLTLLFPAQAFSEIYTSISGQITSEDTGKGIKGAIVIAIDGKRVSYQAIADEKGNYVLKDMPPDMYRLDFYTPEESLYLSHLAKYVELKKGKHLTNVNQVLKLGGAIEGTIFNSDGQPLNIQAQLAVRAKSSNGKDRTTLQTLTKTGGKYSLSGIVESADCEIYLYVRGYKNLEKKVEIKKGQVTKVDFVVDFNDITGVTGYVLSADNQPVKGAPVALYYVISGVGAGTAWTDETGKYSLVGLPPGNYKASSMIAGQIVRKENILIEEGKLKEVIFKLEKPESSSLLYIWEYFASLFISDAHAYEATIIPYQITISKACEFRDQDMRDAAWLASDRAATGPPQISWEFMRRMAYKLRQGIFIECYRSYEDNDKCTINSRIFFDPRPVKLCASTPMDAIEPKDNIISLCPYALDPKISTCKKGCGSLESEVFHEWLHLAAYSKDSGLCNSGDRYISEQTIDECEKSLFGDCATYNNSETEPTGENCT